MKKEREIQVINTYRKENKAYVAFCELHEYGKSCSNWTNWSFPLDMIESFFGCKFEDGPHSFVSVKVDEDVDIWRKKIKE